MLRLGLKEMKGMGTYATTLTALRRRAIFNIRMILMMRRILELLLFRIFCDCAIHACEGMTYISLSS
jgi:hypothetical protein